MINNNTQNKPKTTTTKTSESVVYLKKSELPSNVSSFKNDAGYITSSGLSVWLKEHSYIPKSEINTLISKVDTSNKSVDSTTIQYHTSEISEIKGEIVAIKDILGHLGDNYINIDKEGDFATKEDINQISDRIDSIDLSNYATKDEIPELAEYAKRSWVESQGYLTSHQDLSEYAKISDIPDTSNFAIKSEIPDTSDFITRDEIPSVDGLASKEWVSDQGYLTSHQDLSEYAKISDIPNTSNFATKSEIPSLDGYATESWVEDKHYLTEHQSLSAYVKTSDLTSRLSNYAQKSSVYTKTDANNIFLTKTDAASTYPTKTEVSNAYLKKQDAASTYLRIEDYKGIKNAVVINVDYKDRPYEDFEAALPTLRDGFYIVNGDNIIIVKDHIPVVENGSTSPELAEYAKRSWVEAQGYLTAHQDLSDYALKSEIPSLNGYATEQWVENQGYLTEVPKLKWIEV